VVLVGARRRDASPQPNSATTSIRRICWRNVSWVRTRLNYVPGSSDSIDGAADILLAGAGVCRDFAHLIVACPDPRVL
jgi:transglutaminase-like putative cysteine protease